MAGCSSYNRKVAGSNPGSALLIPEVNVVDIQLSALLGHAASWFTQPNVWETVCVG